ncbi:putative tailspike protein [Edwardsiella phage vB_EpP_ZHX]|nr:putative tailspike protein [Edwardsiella phage vB_EpP_ZHX]
MQTKVIKKSLAAQQDMLLNPEVVQQMRGGAAVNVNGFTKSFMQLWIESVGPKYAGNCEAGCTVTTDKTVVVSLVNGKAYEWTGAVPHVVVPGINPEDPASGFKLAVGYSLREQLASNSGASMIGADSGKTVQQELAAVKGTYGVLLSSYKDSQDPVTAAMAAAQAKGVAMIVDMNADYDYLVLYTGDRVMSLGNFTLTKRPGTMPNLPTHQQPDRPPQSQTSFNVDAGIIVVHPDTGFAVDVEVDGVNFLTKDKSEFGIFAPVVNNCKFTNCSFTGFRRGIRCYNASYNTFTDLRFKYYYTSADTYSEMAGIELNDPASLRSGTGNKFSGVLIDGYKTSYLMHVHGSASFSSCIAKNVNTIVPVTAADHPVAFNIINCDAVRLESPVADGLYGSFLVVDSTTAPSSVVVTDPDVGSGVFGTASDVGAKIFNSKGGASSITVDGGSYRTNAPGYYLNFGGAFDTSQFDLRNADLTKCIDSIKNQPVPTGVNRITSSRTPIKFSAYKLARNTSPGDNFEFAVVEDDKFGIGGRGVYFRVPMTGNYRVRVNVGTYSLSDGATLDVRQAVAASGMGTLLTLNQPGRSTEKQTVYVDYTGKLNGGQFLHFYGNGIAGTNVAGAGADRASYLTIELI